MNQKLLVLVIDSSVAVKWLIIKDEHYIKQADKILSFVKEGRAKLLMPELAKYEIGNVLLNKKLSQQDVEQSLYIFYKIPINFYQETYALSLLTSRIALDKQITYYDASFMALAKEQKAVLVTDNPKHQNKKISGLKVVSLQNYR